MKNGSDQRDAKWTESIAVGDKEFVMETKAKLGAKAIGRRELENNEGYELKEPFLTILTAYSLFRYHTKSFQKFTQRDRQFS